MSKLPTRISKLTAQQIHFELVTRATNLPGREVLDWCHAHPDVVSLLSGSMPGHTSAVNAAGMMEGFTRHRDALRPLRAMAFGRWSPTHLWVVTGSTQTAASLVDAAKGWNLTRDAHEGRWFDRDPRMVSLRCLDGAREGGAAPDDAVRSLRDDPAPHEATPLELQLELMRRTRFNAFRGPRIYDDLLARRDLWRAAIFGRDDVVFVERNGEHVHAAPFWNTLNLLPVEAVEGYNADQLWVLTPSADAGRALLDLARQRWRCDERRMWNRANSHRAAGCQGDERIVSLWWD